MCWGCFKEYADAPVVNDQVVAAYRLMEGKDAGSSDFLHIIVGDMNVDDWWFDLIDLDDETRQSRKDLYADAEQWERDIFDALKPLSEEERATAVAMEWGYILPDGSLRRDLVVQ